VRGHEVLEWSFWPGLTGIMRDKAGFLAVSRGFHVRAPKLGGARQCLESPPV
jgi:hypothetical protein